MFQPWPETRTDKTYRPGAVPDGKAACAASGCASKATYARIPPSWKGDQDAAAVMPAVRNDA